MKYNPRDPQNIERINNALREVSNARGPGLAVGDVRSPTSPATQSNPVRPFGVDVRALAVGVDSNTGTVQNVALSGNNSDAETEVQTGLVKTDTYLSIYDQYNGTWSRKRGNTHQLLLASAARVATTTSDAAVNYNARGAHFIVNVMAIGASTLTPQIEAYDPVSRVWYALLTGAAIAATGITVLKIYPGITPVANVSAADILPKDYRVTCTHSGAVSITYSISASLVV